MMDGLHQSERFFTTVSIYFNWRIIMASNISIENSKAPYEIIVRLSSVYPSLKTAEKKAADFFLTNPDFVAYSPITEVANRAGCSEPTFLRLARKLGYEGYTDFKDAIISADKKTPHTLQRTFECGDSPEDTVKKVFLFSIQAIEDTFNILDTNEVLRAIKYIRRSKKIIFYGNGVASYVAGIAYNKFLRAGIECVNAHNIDQGYTYCANASENDVLFIVSHSGKAKSTVNLAKYAKTNNLKVVVVTNYPMAYLSKSADVLLLTASFVEHFDGESLSKRMAELCMIECVYTLLVLNDEKMLAAIDKNNEVRDTVNNIAKTDSLPKFF